MGQGHPRRVRCQSSDTGPIESLPYCTDGLEKDEMVFAIGTISCPNVSLSSIIGSKEQLEVLHTTV